MAMPMPIPVPLQRDHAPETATADVPPSRERPRTRLSPDEEAMQLMMKVVERVEVAKSFAKIAAGLATVSAARAGASLRAAAESKIAEAAPHDRGVLSHVETLRKIARAAKDAAVHVATHRAEPRGAETDTAAGADTEQPETERRPAT